MQEWTVVIPVRGATLASKSRFGPGDNRELALAMALDTVEAALAVAPVVVVTTGGDEFEALGAEVVQEEGDGLLSAVASGLDYASRVGRATAILLGDHPALRPDELRAALTAAEAHPLALVADSDGTGTALIAALAGVDHRPAFGSGSRAAHVANGYVEIVGDWPGLSRDIDVPEHLAGLTLGPRTRALLDRHPTQAGG